MWFSCERLHQEIPKVVMFHMVLLEAQFGLHRRFQRSNEVQVET